MAVISRQQPIELVQALGSLLSSIVEAQADSARATIEFIMDPVFNETVDGKRQFRTTTIRYSKLDENQEEHDFDLEIPLLSLVNIPQIAVRTARIDLSYDVTQTTTQDSGGRRKIFGRIGKRDRSKTESSYDGSVDLSLEMTSELLPTGLERLLEALELSPREAKENDT